MKKEEAIYSEKDVMQILEKLGLTPESNNKICDCGCEDDDDYDEDVEIGYPCTLNVIPKYDVDKFQKGVDSISEMCGSITALTNCGLKIPLAVEMVMNLKMMDKELEALEKNGEIQKEVSKNTMIQLEKQQI